VKRYGLPIGTPLGQGNKQLAQDQGIAHAYDTFMAASTPGDQSKAASWMSNDELTKASRGLFSFQSNNQRDESGRMALVRELAARGIDPHVLGYTGGPVVLNPNPKTDPTVKAAQQAQKTATTAQKAADRAAQQAQQQAFKQQQQAAQAKQQAVAAEQAQADLSYREQLGNALAQGRVTDQQTQNLWNERQRRLAMLHAQGG
jgi:hypothetical protein